MSNIDVNTPNLNSLSSPNLFSTYVDETVPLPSPSVHSDSHDSDEKENEIKPNENKTKGSLRKSTKNKNFSEYLDEIGYDEDIKLRHPHRWTKDEDEKLVEAVKANGERNWRKIASSINILYL